MSLLNGNSMISGAAARVFVVDDDPKILRIIADVLDGDGWTVETYTRASDFLDAYRPGVCQCVLLDIQMPGLSGLDLQKELQARQIDIPVVVLSATVDIPTAVEIMKRGAMDVLQKPFDSDELIQVVRKALARDAKTARDRTQREEIRERMGKLTPRERDVMELVVAGKANKQIARELKVSERTVEIHRGRVMKKMHADSVADLVRLSAIGVNAGSNPSR